LGISSWGPETRKKKLQYNCFEVLNFVVLKLSSVGITSSQAKTEYMPIEDEVFQKRGILLSPQPSKKLP